MARLGPGGSQPEHSPATLLELAEPSWLSSVSPGLVTQPVDGSVGSHAAAPGLGQTCAPAGPTSGGRQGPDGAAWASALLSPPWPAVFACLMETMWDPDARVVEHALRQLPQLLSTPAAVAALASTDGETCEFFQHWVERDVECLARCVGRPLPPAAARCMGTPACLLRACPTPRAPLARIPRTWQGARSHWRHRFLGDGAHERDCGRRAA